MLQLCLWAELWSLSLLACIRWTQCFLSPTVWPQWHPPCWLVRRDVGEKRKGLYFKRAKIKTWTIRKTARTSSVGTAVKKHTMPAVWARRVLTIQETAKLFSVGDSDSRRLHREILHSATEGQSNSVILNMRSSLVIVTLITWMSLVHASEYWKTLQYWWIECIVWIFVRVKLIFLSLCVSCLATGRVADCCLSWSTTRVKLERIVNYTNQSEGVCPIKAVV